MARDADVESDLEIRFIDGPFSPGTVLLEDVDKTTGHGDGHLVLQPHPSSDPNDPLNWSNRRKYVNFGIVSFYALMIFTILDIGPVVWQDFNTELGITYPQLNDSFAANCAGLAVGCIIFIPFALKYGRRPVYIISTAITFAMAVWQAKLNTFGEMIATQVISGLSGAVSETLVQMTVADVFFVHQRGTMNGIYLLMVNIGSFLAPVASGYIANSQGWRWLYWWCSIFVGLNVVLFIFFYEETKFTLNGLVGLRISNNTTIAEPNEDASKGIDDRTGGSRQQTLPEPAFQGIDPTIPMKGYRERLAFTTVTLGPFKKFFCHTYQPFIILFTFPAVAYTALQYGSILAWFSILATTEATYFAAPPYNFGPIGIGLLNLPSFLGTLLGAVYGGPLSDWSILWFTKRNHGVYEPEMRLFLTVFPVLVGPAGLFLYGYSLAAGMPWIVPCVGAALFGFTLSALGGTSLTYLSDSYREIVGDSLVAVAFVRNVFATIVVFVLTPWINSLGLHHMFTSVGCIALGLNLTVIPIIIWGKKFRIMCAQRYAIMAEKQFDARSI